jgi:hypothetical protein
MYEISFLKFTMRSMFIRYLFDVITIDNFSINLVEVEKV